MRFLMTMLLVACGGDASVSEPVSEAPPELPVPPVVETPEVPCIVGRWVANDFVAAVRESIRAESGDARLTRASGTITIEIGELSPDGTGNIVATADELVHRAVIGKGAFRGTGTHTMTGGSTMPYRLPAANQLLILPPTEGEVTARVAVGVRIGKVRRGRTQTRSSPVNFAGLYAYDCNEDRLGVRRVQAGNRFGEPVLLDRESTEAVAP